MCVCLSLGVRVCVCVCVCSIYNHTSLQLAFCQVNDHTDQLIHIAPASEIPLVWPQPSQPFHLVLSMINGVHVPSTSEVDSGVLAPRGLSVLSEPCCISASSVRC
jgi:hypothetical protein